MTRLAALLAFWDEEPDWLTNCVASLELLGVTHLIALDGSYKNYPNPGPCSEMASHEAIREAAKRVGIDARIRVPYEPWATEMEKRTFLFERGLELEADWFFVVDADEVVLESPDLPPILEKFKDDAAEVSLREVRVFGDAHHVVIHPWRMFFRALPGLKVVGTHCTYRAGDKVLWGSHWREQVPAQRIEEVVVEHRLNQRSEQRKAQAKAYYAARDTLGLEVPVA